MPPWAAAKAAFPQWAGLPATERAKKIRALGELIAKHVPEIARTETDDTGQTISQTGKQLVPRAADNFSYFAEMCVRVDGHTYPTPTHLNYTLFHPVGVCALISPWNVPFMTATWKVAPCLAFGNTAVLKMSELSPLTAARLGELALEAGIPAGVLNIVHGFGKEAGEPLCAHPDVRAISFTGSTATGNRIVRAAGLKKFSMELGGKSPFVIFDDADLDRALDAAVFMIFSNNGERCTAGSRILVQQSIYADFAARFAERAKRITVGDPQDEATIVGPMISQGHLAKVRSYIELGPKEGATLLCGGLDRPGYAPELSRAREGRQLRLADRVCRRRQPHADRTGRNLRPRGLPDPVQGRTGRHPPRPTTSSTACPATSGARTSAARTAWPPPSRPACASSTARTCATCASPSAAPRPAAPGAKAAPGATRFFWSPRTSRCRWAVTTFRTGESEESP
jgi:hypothetical protein